MSSIQAGDYIQSVPVANLNTNFEMHRLFTFPLRLFREKKFDLLRKLENEGFYYDHERGFVRSIYCEMTISAEELADILSQDIKDAEKIISERLVQSNCDISRNVPTGNVDGMLNYKYEAHRLFSLLKNIDHFPDLNIYDLAKSGLYYLGENDKVKCVFCGLEIHGWKQQDKPDEQHLFWNPDCRFMLKDINATAKNIPIGSEQIGDTTNTDSIVARVPTSTKPIEHTPDIVPADGAAGGQDVPQQAPQMQEQPAGDPDEAAQPEPDGPQQDPAGNQ